MTLRDVARDVRWFAVAPSGVALRIGPLGLLIGRHPSCDLVLDDPRISRRHLLLQADGGRVTAVAMAEGGTTINGRTIDAPIEVGAADLLTVADGTVLRVQAAGSNQLDHGERWGIEVATGQSAAVTSEIAVGGAWQDDVVIDGWPPGALRLFPDRTLGLEAQIPGIAVDDRSVEVGERVTLAVGSRIAIGGRTVRVVAAIPADETTISAVVVPPTSIELEMLPTGGRMTVRFGGAPRIVMLSERRFTLAIALLDPSAPQRPGDFVPDDQILPRVWPRQAGVDRGDLNQLVHRLRGDLTSAGLDGARMIERLPKGGATRFVVAAETRIERRG